VEWMWLTTAPNGNLFSLHAFCHQMALVLSLCAHVTLLQWWPSGLPTPHPRKGGSLTVSLVPAHVYCFLHNHGPWSQWVCDKVGPTQAGLRLFNHVNSRHLPSHQEKGSWVPPGLVEQAQCGAFVFLTCGGSAPAPSLLLAPCCFAEVKVICLAPLPYLPGRSFKGKCFR
jgi:hypothetical protein